VLVVASRSTGALTLRLTSEGQEAWYRASIIAPSQLSFATGETAVVAVTVTNVGRDTWDSRGGSRVRFSYRWLLRDEDRADGWGGLRTDFPGPVEPGQSVSLLAPVRAPGSPGRYRLMWDVEQERRFWFSTEPGAPRFISDASVSGPVRGVDGPWVPLTPAGVRPGRRILWRAALQMAVARPLTGVGPDNYRLRYGDYAGLPSADPRVHSNNMYLEVLAGSGIAGASAFAWLLWRAAATVAGALRRAAGAWMPLATSGVAAAAAAIALHGLVDSFMSFTATYVLFAITLGLVAACGRLTAEAGPDGQAPARP
jgi:hypothetical protein